jgi:hypothetical protein
MVISLSAKGLTTREIAAHLAEVYGAEVSTQTIFTITDKVVEGMAEWQNRPLDAGRFLTVIANPDPKGFRCRIARGTGADGGQAPLLRADPARPQRLDGLATGRRVLELWVASGSSTLAGVPEVDREAPDAGRTVVAQAA